MKLIIYLKEHEAIALKALAEQEYRAPKAQASLIIRQELERLGLIEREQVQTLHSPSAPRENISGD